MCEGNEIPSQAPAWGEFVIKGEANFEVRCLERPHFKNLTGEKAPARFKQRKERRPSGAAREGGASFCAVHIDRICFGGGGRKLKVKKDLFEQFCKLRRLQTGAALFGAQLITEAPCQMVY